MNRITELLKKSRVKCTPEHPEIVLDGDRLRTMTEEDAKAFEEFAPILEYLSMNQCCLSNLRLPKLPKLKVIELHDNRLTADCFEVIAEQCPALEKLLMAGNKLSGTIDILAPLKKLEHLEELDLDETPFMDKKKDNVTNEAIFEYMGPKLKLVNDLTRDGKEVEEEKSVDEEDDEESDTSPEDEDMSGGQHRSLLASLINGKFDDDEEEDLEDYNPESDEGESDDSMMESDEEGQQ